MIQPQISCVRQLIKPNIVYKDKTGMTNHMNTSGLDLLCSNSGIKQKCWDGGFFYLWIGTFIRYCSQCGVLTFSTQVSPTVPFGMYRKNSERNTSNINH